VQEPIKEDAALYKKKRLSLTKVVMLKRALRKILKGALGVNLLDAIRMGAKANLLPGGAITVSSTFGNFSPTSTVDGIYPFDCNHPNALCKWASNNEQAWFMIELDRAVYIETIFFLDRPTNWMRSRAVRFLVGFETDPAKLEDNPECEESVGILSDRSDQGYFKCGLWGKVLVVKHRTEVGHLRILELRAYSWPHLSSRADPSK